MKNKITVFIFLTLLFVLSFLNLFNPEKSFSDNENRKLQEFPEVKTNDIFSGRFTDKLDNWVSDQFIFRDGFITIKAVSNLLLGKLENNEVYIGKDNYLIERFVLNSKKVLNANLQAIKNLNADIILIPSNSYVSKDKLMPFSYNTDPNEIFDGINFGNLNYIDVSDDMESSDYFKSDHHININGAYKIYKVFAEYKGFRLQNFTLENVANDFKGTMYSKSGLFYLVGEKLDNFKELNNLNVEVIYDSRIVKNSVLNYENLDKKDKYTFFMDGNHSLVEIDNLDDKSGNNLLIITDSYGHIFAPLLVNHYDTISMIDMRYYRNSVSEYINSNNINNILIFYGLENFCEDDSLRLLK